MFRSVCVSLTVVLHPCRRAQVGGPRSAAARVASVERDGGEQGRARRCLHRLRLRCVHRTVDGCAERVDGFAVPGARHLLGGVNRACSDGHLNRSVGLLDTRIRLEPAAALRRVAGAMRQRCKAREDLVGPATAANQGTAAADDAVSLDREVRARRRNARSTSTWRATRRRTPRARRSCRRSSRRGSTSCARRGSWPASTAALRRRCATSRHSARRSPTRRGSRTGTASKSVFGDPHVSDSVWANHQRVHQYKGGHKETWGGVTINIDSNYVDGPVLGGVTAPPPPPPAAGGLGRLG